MFRRIPFYGIEYIILAYSYQYINYIFIKLEISESFNDRLLSFIFMLLMSFYLTAGAIFGLKL